MTTRTAIFRKLVRDFMRGVPPVAVAGSALGDAVASMADADASAIVVTDANGRPLGIVTEQDIARRVTFQRDAGAPVESVMTAPVRTVADDDYLYHAIARMRRRGLRHMPVVDGDGRLTGIIHLHDALAHVSETLTTQIDVLTREDSIDGLKAVKGTLVELADQLLTESLPATEIQALLTDINNDIYRRVIELNLGAMAEQGLGAPPVAFAVVVMGSGGRGENFLFPDQDNGFILDDYDDDGHGDIDDWFIELAERMTRDLDAVGLPLCEGYVMATNPLWRKTLPQWREQIRLWSRKRNVTAIRLCDIFFDFLPVWGKVELADTLRADVTRLTHDNPAFLREMQADDADHRVALGWFGRFVTERDDKDHLGKINLKHTGTLPLVEAMRLLALRQGITAVATLKRMAALHDAGVLNTNERDYLAGAYRHISRLLLRAQINDFKAGKTVSNYVDPKTLTRRERDMLVDSFKAIRRLRERIRGEFTGETF